MSTERNFSKGEVIFRQGDAGNSFFKIIEGSVSVIANYGEADERELTVLNPGEFFGEMAVIETYPRSNTIVAVDNVRTIEITADELNGFFAENPDMIYQIMKHIGAGSRHSHQSTTSSLHSSRSSAHHRIRRANQSSQRSRSTSTSILQARTTSTSPLLKLSVKHQLPSRTRRQRSSRHTERAPSSSRKAKSASACISFMAAP